MCAIALLNSNISLSEANLNPDAILNESVRKEVLEWSNKNRQN